MYLCIYRERCWALCVCFLRSTIRPLSAHPEALCGNCRTRRAARERRCYTCWEPPCIISGSLYTSGASPPLFPSTPSRHGREQVGEEA
uniref:Putative secreted protein n=1 Tax=Rhipicephalus microplus TaxID=6941 RepID=A0A6M2DAF0_RHIMP